MILIKSRDTRRQIPFHQQRRSRFPKRSKSERYDVLSVSTPLPPTAAPNANLPYGMGWAGHVTRFQALNAIIRFPVRRAAVAKHLADQQPLRRDPSVRFVWIYFADSVG